MGPGQSIKILSNGVHRISCLSGSTVMKSGRIRESIIILSNYFIYILIMNIDVGMFSFIITYIDLHFYLSIRQCWLQWIHHAVSSIFYLILASHLNPRFFLKLRKVSKADFVYSVDEGQREDVNSKDPNSDSTFILRTNSSKERLEKITFS